MPRPELSEPQRAFLAARHAYLRYERHVSIRTVWQYRLELEQFWHHAGVRDPAKVTPKHLTAYVERPIPAGQGRRNGGSKRLASSTAATYGNHILAAYRWAFAAGIIARNPLGKVASFRDDPGPPRSLPLAAVMRLLDYAATDRRLLVMVWLAYGVGLRCFEIARLRVGDLVLGSRPELWVLDGKGARTDKVPLHPFVAALLAGSVAGRPASAPVIDSKTRPGQPITDKTVSKLLARAMRAAGIGGTGHWLRHTFATELLAAGKGANLRAVSTLLRHRDLGSTRRYVSAYDQDAYDTIAMLPVTPADAGADADAGEAARGARPATLQARTAGGDVLQEHAAGVLRTESATERPPADVPTRTAPSPTGRPSGNIAGQHTSPGGTPGAEFRAHR